VSVTELQKAPDFTGFGCANGLRLTLPGPLLNVRRIPMGKQGSKKGISVAGTLLLAVLAGLLFVLGEALILTRTDAGRLTAARWLGLGDTARITAIVGKHARDALANVGVPRDSIHETVIGSATPAVRWRVGLRPRASALQLNYALTRALQSQGAAVLSGREGFDPHGAPMVTLVVGVRGHPTHEIDLVSPLHTSAAATAAAAAGRLSLVLFGLGDDARRVVGVMRTPLPFAVAIPAGQPWSQAAFHAARERQREVVLHLPLEPLNYPQVDPGPGAILVTMGRSKIESTVRHDLDEAGGVAAVANLMGSLATQDQTVMTAVYDVLRERRAPFLHMTPAAGSVCRALASQMGVVYQEPDVVLDAEALHAGKALDARWRDVLDRTRRRGQAIVMLRATDAALAWLPAALSAKRLGSVEIVPLASLVRRAEP